MANIKRGARAYYADTDYRRDGMNEAYSKIDSLPAIPTPAAGDVGKVVKVGENGNYGLAQDAGAKELVVTLANDFTADKTYTEILTALNNGDIVKLVDWTGRNYIYSGMTSGRICFAYLNGYSNTNESDVFTVAVDDTNSWEMFLDTITHLPDVSSADAGKVLTVDSNGAWGADNVPSELPTVTSADAGKVLMIDDDGSYIYSHETLVIEGTITNVPKPTSATFSDTVSNILTKIKDYIDKNLDVVVRLKYTATGGSSIQVHEYKLTTYSFTPGANFIWCYMECVRTVYNDGIYNSELYLESSNNTSTVTIINTKL